MKNTELQKSLTWWNKLSIPQKANARKFCYPQQKSVYVSEKQIQEMYNLREFDITKSIPITPNKFRGYSGYHHVMSKIFNK